MKKNVVLFFMMTILAAASLQAQIRKVPADVTDAFKAKYPNAQKVEWKDKITHFQAQFVSGTSEMEADFTSKGKWEETETKSTFDLLPSAVKDGLKKSKYNGWTPGSVTRIDKSDRSVKYRIYVEKSSLVQKKFLTFNDKGQLEKESQSI